MEKRNELHQHDDYEGSFKFKNPVDACTFLQRCMASECKTANFKMLQQNGFAYFLNNANNIHEN